MKTLIVGCGYLGTRVASKLLARGETVLGTTRTPDRASRLAEAGIEPILLDVNRPPEPSAFPVVDRVLHCVGFDRSGGATRRDVYVVGLGQVLEALRGRFAKLVYVGSTSVYGQSNGEWVDEESETAPTTESGRVCLEAEQTLAGFGIELSLLRYSGLYGPGRVIGRASLERGEGIAGDPSAWLNLIEIDDAAEAAIAVLDRGEANGLYLATDDQPIVRRNYYETVAELLGVDPPRFSDPEGGTTDRSNKRVSNRKIRDELGFQCRYPDIRSGLRHALGFENR